MFFLIRYFCISCSYIITNANIIKIFYLCVSCVGMLLSSVGMLLSSVGMLLSSVGILLLLSSVFLDLDLLTMHIKAYDMPFSAII